MTIEITGAPEPPACDPPDVLQQDGVHTQDQASDTTVLITEAQVALCTAAATGMRRKDRRWVALLSRIFVRVDGHTGAGDGRGEATHRAGEQTRERVSR
jgi:hypothetical protein